ncbi:hypothetical protein CORC01_10555 [Colletotrichum orchidophilum]|uniref:Uncharacterized protein n=1 Tax=Colletotrichum orchidophilum TaxID=1209926 RepID=A0A1G4AY55_9PEZI|nr:uncharacterized protein CORC01_10555 [Colletotrichum orchidophilum]OHE94098.1 hypothetical protein CORC01_10555 [Colletotrichum orchidophilum]
MDLKIIIGRGSVAGITPANMPEKFDRWTTPSSKLPSRSLPRSAPGRAAMAEESMDEFVTDKPTFGHPYESENTSALGALEEHAFSQWHFERIVRIRDSSHKTHSITAQDVNNAIESAAHLLNAPPKITLPTQSVASPSSKRNNQSSAIQPLHRPIRARRAQHCSPGRRAGSLFCLSFPPLSKDLFRRIIP